MGRREHRAGLDDDVARLQVVARSAYVITDRRVLFDDDDVALGVRALDHHHGVGTARQRRTGHDAHRLAGAHAHVARVSPGRQRAHDLQLDRRVGRVDGLHGEAVHRRVVEWRYGLLGFDGHARDASQGVL